MHHARKGAARARAGQALRGSSELHAWGDSNLYLRRKDEVLLLTVEHRAAPSRTGLVLELQTQDHAVALKLVEHSPPTPNPDPPTAEQRIEHVLATSSTPLSLHELRSASRMRTATLCQTLATLTASGRVLRSDLGYALANH